MAEDKKKGGEFSLPATGIIAAASLIGYLLIGPSAFVDERPNAPQGMDNDDQYAQDVDARLWQDPFGAIKEKFEDSKNTTTLKLVKKTSSGFEFSINEKGAKDSRAEHGPQRIFLKEEDGPSGEARAAKHEKEDITVVAAMVSAGPYSEQQEMRIRRRYALASALSALRFKPRDSQHVGYFIPAERTGLHLPDAVPFEWYDPQEPDVPCVPRSAFQCTKVLVLWIDDARFYKNPAEKIREIFTQVKDAGKDASFHYAVIGPNDSGQLSALAEASDAPGMPARPGTQPVAMKDIHFYSAAATAEAAWILEGKKQGECGNNSNPANGSGKKERGGVAEEEDLSCALQSRDVNLVRTVADDGVVAEELVKELGKRRVESDNHDSHVVLVSDWDTFYGRSLPLTFARAYFNRKYAPLAPTGESGGNWMWPHPEGADSYNGPSECEKFANTVPPTGRVHCFSYVRGIDGKLPGSEGKEKDETKDASKSDAGGKPASRVYDRPEGFSQKDYLRRLVDQVRDLDRRLKGEQRCLDPSKRCGVSAIGVLGYDVYDKLAILQALRSYFPGKIFFTTELDALYSSPRELPYTKNLIVASSFGLNLRPEIQRNIPPFRDSYQTSFFLATQLAVLDIGTESGKKSMFAPLVRGWLHEARGARVFEIGRNGPVDLSGKPGDEHSTECSGLFQCDDIHPQSVWVKRSGYETALAWILFVLGLPLLYRVSWKFRGMAKRVWRELAHRAKSPASRWKAALTVASAVAVGAGFFWCYSGHNEEPLLWTDGISIWPSEMLRMLGLAVTIVFLFKMRNELGASIRKQPEKENGHAGDEGEKGLTRRLEDKYGLAPEKGLECVPLSTGLKSIYDWKCPALKDGKVDVGTLWQEYLERNAFHARVVRSSINLSIFVAFSYFAVLLSGGLPVPARGDFAFWTDWLISVLAGLSALLLTMLVVDASRLGDRLIEHLNSNGKPTAWPCAEKVAEEWGFSEIKDNKYVVYWIDVMFVGDLTETIGQFIWYPVISLFLIVAARSMVFDESVLSYGLIASLAVLLLYLFSCAFWLQNGAKKMRAKAISQLNAELRKLRGGAADRGENSADESKNAADESENAAERSQPGVAQGGSAPANKDVVLLESMIKEVEGIGKGAFTPFLQQPFVKAVVATLGGGGALPLLERLL